MTMPTPERVTIDGRHLWRFSDGTLLPVVAGAEDPPADPEPDPEPPADPTPDPQDPPPADPDDGPDPDPDDPETFSREYVAELRQENARHRTRARDIEQRFDETMGALRRALGVEDDEPDPEQLSSDVARLQAENRRLRTRQSFDALARAAGADEDLTWGYLLARGELEDIDPESDDFTETLQARVEAAVEAKPSLATRPSGPSSGGGDLGGENPPTVRPEEMSMEEYIEWRNKQKE